MIPICVQLMALALGLLLTTVYSVEQTCSRQAIPVLQSPGRVDLQVIKSLTTVGPMRCARTCLLWSLCESFSFEAVTGLCELSSLDANDNIIKYQGGFVVSDIKEWPSDLAGTCSKHTCPKNTACEPQSQPMCKIIGCLFSDIPQIEHAELRAGSVSTGEFSPIETKLTYDCGAGFLPSTESTCGADGTWKPTACQLVPLTSCLHIKKSNTTGTTEFGDGEYWMTLTAFDHYRTRIYCHDMKSEDPKEYLTFPHNNTGLFPDVSNATCTEMNTGRLASFCRNLHGSVTYYKVRINLATMTVDQTDYTFATFSHAQRPYGQALDCYTPHFYKDHITCGTKGFFAIDLTKTGWRVHANQTWVTTGNAAMIDLITWDDAGTRIMIKCGGFTGGCKPNNGLTLVPNPAQNPTEDKTFLSP